MLQLQTIEQGKGHFFWQKGVLQQKLDFGDGHGRFLLEMLKHKRIYRLKDQEHLRYLRLLSVIAINPDISGSH